MNVDLKIQTNTSPSLMLDMKTEDTSGLALNIESEQSLELSTSGGYYNFAADYEQLINKPSIEGIELLKDKTFDELGLQGSDNVVVSHGKIGVPEITTAQLATILTDD